MIRLPQPGKGLSDRSENPGRSVGWGPRLGRPISSLAPGLGGERPLRDPSSLTVGANLLTGDLTGLVLAGGASRRMGREKALLELGGRPLIEIVVERMMEVCGEVLIVAGDLTAYTGFGVAVVKDRFQGVGVLGGLHAGLTAAAHDLTLAVGSDMPFLRPEVLRAFAVWAEGYDVAVLRHNGYVEPLHGAYRRACLPSIEAAIRAGKRRVISFFPQVRVGTVTPEDIAPMDPHLESFRNLNTPEDWEAAKEDWSRM